MVSIDQSTFQSKAPGRASLLDVPAGRVSWRIWALWLVVFGAFSMIIPRDASYDVVHYHLYNGWAFLNAPAGGHLAPAEMHSFLNPLWQALVWQLIEVLPGHGVAFVLGALQALILPVLYALTRRALAVLNIIPPAAAVLSIAVAGFLCEAQFGLLSSVRNDALSALLFLAALLSLFPSKGGAPRLKDLAWASALLGLGLGLKPTNGVYVVGFAVAAIVALPDWQARVRGAAVCALCGAFGILAGGGIWMWHLWETFGNPLFPMANDVFAAPLGPEGGFRDTRYLPDGPLDALWRPFAFLFNGELINEHDFFDPRFLMAYLAAPAILIMAWQSKRLETRPLVALAAAIVAVFAAWSAVFSIARYAAALWMLGPTTLAVALALARPKWLTSAKSGLYAVVGAVLLVAVTKPAQLRRVPLGEFGAPYVSVSLPDVTSYHDATIVFAGGYPSAFMAYAFPGSAQITHTVPQDWSAPALERYREALIRPAIVGSETVYAVIVDTEDHFEETKERLARIEGYGLNEAHCEVIETNFSSEGVAWRICPMVLLK